MATIKVKNSVTSGSNPSGLTFGELAVNITDRKIYIGNAVGSTITLHDQNNIVTSFNGSTGAVVGVSSINGSTGAITNIARTNEGNTFTVQQVFNAGITASTTTNVLDIIATTDGAGLRIAQTASGSSARVGGIRLGRSTSNATNSYIENYVGILKFFNGISGTNNTPGLNMLQLSTTNAQFGVPIDGATFSSTTGEVKIQKSAYLGFGDSAYLRIVGSDTGLDTYNSDIRANADAVTNTIHTLPATTGTLLNSNFNSYVSSYNGRTGAIQGVSAASAGSGISVSGATGAVTITNTGVLSFNGSTGAIEGVSSVNGFTGAVSITYAAAVTITSTNSASTFYPTLSTGAGNTALYVDNVTTPMSYVPSTGALTAKSFNTTAVGGISTTISSGSLVMTDTGSSITNTLNTGGFNIVGSSLSLASDSQVSISSPSTGVQFVDSVSASYNYTFPATNGSNGQVLTTNGANPATLSWSTVSSGSATGFTYTASAPGSPAIGDRWIDSDTGKEYVYVNDGSSSQWIEPVSSNGLFGITYTSSTNFLEFGVTGSFVKLGVNNTSPQYTLDVNGIINAPVGISAGPITSSGATFSGAVVSDGGYRITSSTINAQTGITYTLLTSDNGKIITMSNGSAITLTVPAGLPIGYNTTVIQLGAGQVGITASSTTLNSFEGKLKLAGQHAAASIISYTTNVFNVAGGLTA